MFLYNTKSKQMECSRIEDEDENFLESAEVDSFEGLKNEVNELYNENFDLFNINKKQQLFSSYFEFISDFDDEKMGKEIDRLMEQLQMNHDIHDCLCRCISVMMYENNVENSNCLEGLFSSIDSNVFSFFQK